MADNFIKNFSLKQRFGTYLRLLHGCDFTESKMCIEKNIY